jgi:hypothetical protein
MRVASREVCIAGITTSQMVRNISFADFSFLCGCRYLLHDRDAKLCAALTGILETVGIQAVKLPARRPNLNAHLERWHRSVKKECRWKMIFFGEASLDRRTKFSDHGDSLTTVFRFANYLKVGFEFQ